jgi:phage-related minor tail protein
MAGGVPKLQAEATLNAQPFKEGADQVKTAGKQLADDLKRSGAEGAKSFDGIPAAGEQAAQKLDRSTKSMIASIERATAAAKTGGRNTSEFFEALSAQRGVNATALRPYIDQLRAAEQAQAAATAGLGKMEMSAKQTRAALAQVPAQFTDIVTSLASGSPPLTVLIQQGGQLKDTFGGIGAATQALGNYVLALINPFTVAAAALGALAFGFIKGREEQNEFVRATVLTGNAAGVTADQLSGMADAIDRIGGGTQARAAEVLAAMARSGEVGAENLQRFAAAAIELERAGGPAAEETAKAFAELGRAPLEASLKLNQAQNFLTRATYDQIMALEEQGRTVEAARVAQDAYANAVAQRAPEIIGQLGFIERAWQGIKDAAKEAGDALLSVGRQDTLQQQINTLESLRETLLAPSNVFGGTTSDVAREVAALDARIERLREAQRLQRASAESDAARRREVTAAAEVDKMVAAARSGWQKAELDYSQAIAKLNAGNATPDQRVAVLNAITAKYQEGAKAVRSNNDEEKARAAILAELSGVTASYTQDIVRLVAMRRDGALSEEQYLQAIESLIAKQPFARKAAQEQAAAAREEAQAMAAAVRERQQYLATLDRGADSAQKEVQRLQDELLAITQGKAALEERIQARLIDQAAALEAQARWSAVDETEKEALLEQARALREQARLRREVGSASNDEAVRRANSDAAKAAEADWQRTSDNIEKALTDALMQGGKSGWEYIKGLFRSEVLRPIIQAVVRPVAGTVSGIVSSFLGLPSSAGASTGSGAGFGGYNWGGGGTIGVGGLPGMGGAGNMPGSNWFTDFGGSVSNGVNRIGQQLASSREWADFGTSLMDASDTIGKVAGTLGEVASYYQAFKAAEDGKWGQAIGQAVGTAIGGPLGGMIGNTIGSWVDKIFSGGAGTPHRGSIVRTMADGTQSLARDADWAGILNNYDQRTDQALRTLAGVATGGFNRFASAFGAQGTAQSVISFAADGRDASIGNFQLSADGRSLVNLGGADFARYGSDGAQAFQAFGLDVLKQTRAALDTLDLSQWARDELKKFDESIATLGEGNLERATDLFNNTVEGIARLQAGMVELQRFMEPLGGVFLRVSDLSGDAMKELVDFAGGLENLANQTQSYVQTFFRREEIAGLQAREVRDTLLGAGLTEDQLRGLDTREEFRALVESIDPNTEAGRKQLAALLGVSGTFAGLSDYFGTDGGDLLSAAGQAPNTGPLTPPGAAPGAQSAESPAVSVLTSINAGIDQVVTTLRELLELNRSTPRVAITAPGGTEVNVNWNP